MVKQKKLKKEFALPKAFWVVVTVILAIVLILIGSFFYWKTGWPGYLNALASCNNKPPVEGNPFMVGIYISPGDDKYRIPGENGYRTYFCTASEAEEARYKHKETISLPVKNSDD